MHLAKEKIEMAILTTVKDKMTTGLMTAADKGANLVSKASGLSSDQLDNIEARRRRFMSEKPETSPEGIKRLLGTYAIEAYEAYLPQISCLYEPVSFKSGEIVENDERYLNNRIRYFEITKWVIDPAEDSLEKLVNVYQVVDKEVCNMALIYDRKQDGCHVYLAIVNNMPKDTPQIVDTLEERILAALKGNFPGSEIKGRNKEATEKDKFGIGVLPEFEKIEGYSVASVSNIASEKSADFTNQNIEKLLDGICPHKENDEYCIILLATPSMGSFDRKNELSELYSKLAPFANWQTNFTYSEHMAEGSSATFGASLGASAGRQTGNTNMQGENTSNSYSETRGESHADSKTITNTKSKGGGVSAGTDIKVPLVKKVHVGGNYHRESSKSKAKGKTDTLSNAQTVTDVIGKMSSMAENTGVNLGVNFGMNFARSSNVSVTIGKNEGLTQNFVNYNIRYTLDIIEKQIKRLEESAALGMWDFSAYFISKNPVIANNAAHMYLALTQGKESYLSQSAVNLWVSPPKDLANSDEIEKKRNDVNTIMEYLKRLQQPEFQLRENEGDEWLMYPPHVNTTVSLTGRELARALNFPKKSVSGMPVIECVSFGREVHKYKNEDCKENTISIGHTYHMRHDESALINLDVDSLAAHTFITGSTGSGKSNTIYQILKLLSEKKINFMVVEPAKGEYRKVFGNREDVSVYGTNNKIEGIDLLRINPFSFPKNVHVLEHLDRLVEIFNVCWPMYAAMPAILKDSIQRAYEAAGWNMETSKNRYSDQLFPSFEDVYEQIRKVLNESEYSQDNKGDYIGSLVTRLRSLTTGINGMIFSADEVSAEDLFEKNVIIDLSRVGSSETKALIMGLMVLKLQEHRMKEDKPNQNLKHVTVLEEAHNLLRRTSTEQLDEGSNLLGKSVEMLANSIAEMRTYGEGFIIADQAPGLLDMSVIRNTNTKIILRLPDYSDRELVGRAASLNENQIKELAKLDTGVAAIKQGEWLETVLCKVDKYKPVENEPGSICQSDKKSNYRSTENIEEIITALILNKEIYRKEGVVDEFCKKVIRSKLRVGIKCEILDYLTSDADEVLDALSKLAYDFFHVEEAINKAEKVEKKNISEWTNAVVSNLHPVVLNCANEQVDWLMSLIILEKANRDIGYNDILHDFIELYRAKGRVL